MDEKDLVAVLKDRIAGVEGIEGVHDWPFEGDSEAAFYVETDDHKRFSIRVEEFARFQAGNAYF